MYQAWAAIQHLPKSQLQLTHEPRARDFIDALNCDIVAADIESQL